jgi:hypothetical protein
MLEELLNQFNAVSLSKEEALKHDIEYIIWLYYKEIPTLDPNLVKLKISSDIEETYYDILRILDEKGEKENLLEMMPLIDEYLDYLRKN